MPGASPEPVKPEWDHSTSDPQRMHMTTPSAMVEVYLAEGGTVAQFTVHERAGVGQCDTVTVSGIEPGAHQTVMHALPDLVAGAQGQALIDAAEAFAESAELGLIERYDVVSDADRLAEVFVALDRETFEPEMVGELPERLQIKFRWALYEEEERHRYALESEGPFTGVGETQYQETEWSDPRGILRASLPYLTESEQVLAAVILVRNIPGDNRKRVEVFEEELPAIAKELISERCFGAIGYFADKFRGGIKECDPSGPEAVSDVLTYEHALAPIWQEITELVSRLSPSDLEEGVRAVFESPDALEGLQLLLSGGKRDGIDTGSQEVDAKIFLDMLGSELTGSLFTSLSRSEGGEDDLFLRALVRHRERFDIVPKDIYDYWLTMRVGLDAVAVLAQEIQHRQFVDDIFAAVLDQEGAATVEAWETLSDYPDIETRLRTRGYRRDESRPVQD